MTANNKMNPSQNVWRQGQPLPPAFELCKDDREEREYDLALGDPNRCYGLGTKDDPLVIWLREPENTLDRDSIWAHNNFAKAIAKLLGLTHAWIIRGAHEVQYARDKDGQKIPHPDIKDKWLLRDADMHITLRLGSDLYGCNLSAHAYVVLGARGTPERYMDELARRFTDQTGGDGVKIDLWRWRVLRRRFLPRRAHVSLGANWEAYANVGPYLDTYRPDGRRTTDTYTPRDKNTPPREEGRGEILEGAMTPEVAEQVSMCHAAYAIYKALHEELVAMQYPPDDKLTELHAMREQLVTMKREIYREVKGIVA
ncbi:hypothetical protein GGR50DRAFT_650543 [Xylaria sp. CBS 124048]|nr:hypothetical protein GGR50DRAFT_650543 [Xylaria sp. CBS 124048]